MPSDRAARLARAAAVCGGLVLLAAAAMISTEVVFRRVFSISLIGVDELAGYAFAVAMAWGYAHALFVRAHIRIDVVYLRLPARVQRGLDLMALVAFAGIMGLVVFKGWGTLAETVRLGARASTPLATPLWIPQSIWLAGLAFFCLCIILRGIDLARALLAGDAPLAKRLGAPQSLVGPDDE